MVIKIILILIYFFLNKIVTNASTSFNFMRMTILSIIITMIIAFILIFLKLQT